MRTLSLDLRERILASYDRKEGTREQIAHRFKVSLGMVKKLLQQRRRTGEIAPRHRFSGRKAVILPAYGQAMRTLLRRKPDMTLQEMRKALGLACTLPAIHYALQKIGLTYKKRRSGPANKAVRTSLGRAGSGGARRAAGIRRG
jgi:transposase